MDSKPTFRQVREQAGILRNELARAAGVSYISCYRMERGETVRRSSAWKVINALSKQSGKDYSIDDFSGMSLCG